jgi:glycerol kinase
VAAIAGDQQAALFGQMCIQPGLLKHTYGTGGFMMLNTGDTAIVSKNNLLTTIAWQLNGKVTYALEGSIFIAGAVVQWLRDGLGLIKTSAEIEQLAGTVADNGGVYVVPAFAGLGAPHWDPYARGTITGLTRGVGAAHIARAVIEAMAYQVRDVVDAMRAVGTEVAALRVDGGAAVLDLLLQIQADQLRVPVARPTTTETTALGAATLAGVAEGVWASVDDLESIWTLQAQFEARASALSADRAYDGWRRAVQRSLGWAVPGN